MKVKNDRWREIGIRLKSHFRSQHRYLTSQKFLRDHFLQPVVPYLEKFFGTKTHTVLILAKPYNDEAWPTEAIAEACQLIRRHYRKWPYYKVDIYMDYITSQLEQDQNGPGYSLDDTEERVIELCDQMQDFGFEYKGRLDDPGKDYYAQFEEDAQKFYDAKEGP
jgi:hypothetical protein